jgi:DNA-binding IclR family transcriptional regulator
MQLRDTDGGLQTTARSLQLLELLVTHDGATMAELAAETGLGKSTVHNHLRTLAHYGYVVRENSTDRIGLKFYHLGDYARKQHDA